VTSERIKELIIEKNEKYKALLPYTFTLVDDKAMMNDLEEILFEELKIIGDISTDYVLKLLDYFYPNIILRVLFSYLNTNSFEKNLAKLFENTLCDPQTYDYLMSNMPEFREFSKGLSLKNKRRFQRARKWRAISNVLGIVLTLGISIMFIGRKSQKVLSELANDPLMKDIIKTLTLLGV